VKHHLNILNYYFSQSTYISHNPILFVLFFLGKCYSFLEGIEYPHATGTGLDPGIQNENTPESNSRLGNTYASKQFWHP
jgi:hypothetical protein